MNRIDQKFKDLKAGKKKAFIAYITAGDPHLKATEELAAAFEQAGVDILELGIPFSDPLADGPTIQAAFQRSLAQGTTVAKVFDAVEKIRLRTQMPLVLMTSYNPILSYGEARFIAKCRQTGVDGLIIPDLPPEEASDLRKIALKADISIIFFVAPTTIPERIKTNTMASTGFIYYVALTGITGVKAAQSSDVIKHLRQVKRFTNKPICVGFGITTPQQVKDIAKVADGVIVGSAIVKEIEKNKGKADLVKAVSHYVSSLSKVLK